MYQYSCWDRKPWRPEMCNGQIHLEAEIDWLVLRSFIVNPNPVSRNGTRQPTILAIILTPVLVSSSRVNGKDET